VDCLVAGAFHVQHDILQAECYDTWIRPFVAPQQRLAGPTWWIEGCLVVHLESMSMPTLRKRMQRRAVSLCETNHVCCTKYPRRALQFHFYCFLVLSEKEVTSSTTDQRRMAAAAVYDTSERRYHTTSSPYVLPNE
jgi:hypothetical protein